MSREETTQVLAYLREMFPQGKPVTKNTVSAWHDLLEEYPYEIVWESAKNAVRTWEGMTMPPLAVLINQIKNLQPNDTEIELWRIAEQQIKRGTVMTQEDFDALPEPIRAYFGGVSAFRDLALLEHSELPNERARFINNIGKIVARQEAQARIPENVKCMLDGMVKKLEG